MIVVAALPQNSYFDREDCLRRFGYIAAEVSRGRINFAWRSSALFRSATPPNVRRGYAPRSASGPKERAEQLSFKVKPHEQAAAAAKRFGYGT